MFFEKGVVYSVTFSGKGIEEELWRGGHLFLLCPIDAGPGQVQVKNTCPECTS